MEYLYRGSFSDENHLEHHGILGQKWGIRRYQNEDGTYTAAGKQRYGDSSSTGTSQKKGLSDTTKRRLKTAAKVAVGAAAVGTAAYVGSKAIKNADAEGLTEIKNNWRNAKAGAYKRADAAFDDMAKHQNNAAMYRANGNQAMADAAAREAYKYGTQFRDSRSAGDEYGKREAELISVIGNQKLMNAASDLIDRYVKHMDWDDIAGKYYSD